jgi:hypothetical protein
MRLSISLIKQRRILALALSKVLSKFLMRLLQCSIHALERSTIQRIGMTPKFRYPQNLA